MNTEYSEINLVACTGENGPVYNIKGEIKEKIVNAKITCKEELIGDVYGAIGKLGYFTLRIEFYDSKYNLLEIFGRISDEEQDHEITLDGVAQTYMLKGCLDNKVNLEFTLMNKYGVINLTIEGVIK